jgi:DNA-binding NarL/FixJ family response regulator
MALRILLIGHGLFCEGLARLLAEQSAVHIVGAASSWDEARTVMARETPDVLIVDHAAPELRGADLAPLLEAESPASKVIYLTLAENKMIVHNRQQVADVTLPDLLRAIQGQASAGSERSRPAHRARKAKA